MEARNHLLALLVEHSYLYDKEPRFTLASGRVSETYINCKPTTMRRAAAPSIATLFEEHVPSTAKAVGGLTAGADPIAYAMRDYCRRTPLDAFMVRKQPKEHGLGKSIEGPVVEGMEVVIVDDVVTTGTSTIHAINECRTAKLKVVAVIVLVDREEGGLEAIQAAVGPTVPVRAIYTKSELRAEWSRRQRDGDTHPQRSSAAAR